MLRLSLVFALAVPLAVPMSVGAVDLFEARKTGKAPEAPRDPRGHGRRAELTALSASLGEVDADEAQANTKSLPVVAGSTIRAASPNVERRIDRRDNARPPVVVIPSRSAPAERARPPAELVSRRDVYSKVMDNGDGSETLELSTVPVHYRNGKGGFDVVDSRVVRDRRSGLLRNAAHEWRVTFDAMVPGRGVRFEGVGEPFGFVANDAAPVDPIVEPDGTSVRYVDVFPETDLVYRVSGAGVEELLVLKSASATPVVTFNVAGLDLVEAEGGLVDARRSSRDGFEVRLSNPESFNSAGEVIPYGQQIFESVRTAVGKAETSTTEVTVGLKESWLAKAEASDFPVVVDPSVTLFANFAGSGSPRIWSFQFHRNSGASTGVTYNDHFVRVGNPNISSTSDVRWRSVAGFPYDHFAQYSNPVRVTGSSLVTFNNQVTNNGSHALNGYWADEVGPHTTVLPRYYPPLSNPWSQRTGDYANRWDRPIFTSHVDVGNETHSGQYIRLHERWFEDRMYGGATLLRGNENFNTYSYKKFQVKMSIDYDVLPSDPPGFMEPAGKTIEWGLAAPATHDQTVRYRHELLDESTGSKPTQVCTTISSTTDWSASCDVGEAYWGKTLFYSTTWWAGSAEPLNYNLLPAKAFARNYTGHVVVENEKETAEFASRVSPSSGGFYNGISPTLTIEPVVDPDGDTVYYDYEICPEGETTGCAYEYNSTSTSWQVPLTDPDGFEMRWHQTYVWSVWASDRMSSERGTADPKLHQSQFTPGRTPQDDVDLGAGWNPLSEDSWVDPANGNLRYTSEDVAIKGVVRPLDVVRTYNSILHDDANPGAFGAGWLSPFDMRVVDEGIDGATVRYPDGRHEFFGRNGDGSYAMTIGRPNVLTKTGNTWKLTEPSGVYYEFDANGDLMELRDTNDRSITSTRVGASQIYEDVASGRQLSLTWSAPTGGHIISVRTDPVASHGGQLEWRYYYAGNKLTHVCNPTNTSKGNHCARYEYNSSSGLLERVIRPKGTIGLEVDYLPGQPKVQFQRDGEGNEWEYAYSAVTLTHPAPGSEQAQLHRTEVLDPRGPVPGDPLFNSVFYDFDDQNRLVHFDDRHGAETWYTFDTLGYLAQIATRTGFTGTPWVYEQFVNDDLGNVEARTDRRGNVWTATYSDVAQTGFSRQVTQATPIVGQQVTWEYYPDGNTKKETNGAGDVTTWEYTDGSTTEPPGLVKKLIDPNGNVTEYDYSPTGDLTEQREASGSKTTYQYDEIGRMTHSTVTWDGHVATTTYTYDELSRVKTRTEPAVTNLVTNATNQLRTTYTYDANGNTETIVESDITGNDSTRTTTKQYDANDREIHVTDPEQHTISVVFDEVGNPVEVTDQLNRVTVTDYDHASREVRQVLKNYTTPSSPGAVPRDVVISESFYDDRGRVWKEVDSNGNETRHTYNDGDQLIKTIVHGFKPNQTTEDYVVSQTGYDAAGRVAWVKSGNSRQKVTYTYDLADRVKKEVVEDTVPGYVANDRVATMTFDGNGNTTEHKVTQHGRSDIVRYEYDSNDQVDKMTIEGWGQPDRVTTYTHSQLGHQMSVTDPEGRTTDSTLDIAGRVTKIESPAVQSEVYGQATVTLRPTITTGYDTFGNTTHVVGQAGNETVTTYDKLDRRTQVAHPSYSPWYTSTVYSPTETFSYDAAGNLTSRTDRRGFTTDFEFDSMNRIAIERHPEATPGDGRGEQLTRYDDNGSIVWTRAPDGQVVEFEYDKLGRQTVKTEHVRRPGAATLLLDTTYTYDNAGNLEHTTTPEGHTTSDFWSPSGRRYASVDAAGQETRYVYDVGGRVTKITDPAGRQTVNVYNPFGNLTRTAEKDAAGVTRSSMDYGYDGVGSRVSATTASGDVTTYGYDDLNRLNSVTQEVGGGLPDITTSFGYDSRGLRTRTTDGNGQVWYQQFNEWGLRIAIYEPTTAAHPFVTQGMYRYAYDAGGLPVRDKAPGATAVVRTFDGLGQLTSEQSGSAIRTFDYDRSGRRTEVSHPFGTIGFTYDDRGLLLDVASPDADSSFAYDHDGRITSRTDVAGVASYSWTARNELYAMVDPVTGDTITHTWNPNGDLDRIDYGNNIDRTFTYDPIGRLETDTVDDGGVTRWSASYGYDVDGYVQTKTVGGSGTAGNGTNSYTYDAAGRLKTWTDPAGATTTYSWDGNGNRLTAGSETFAYDERNRLLSDGDATYTWARRGTLESRTEAGNTVTYAFDGLGRMTRADTVDYVYDGLSRVVRREGVAFDYSGMNAQASSDGTTTIARTAMGNVASIAEGNSTRLHTARDRHGDLSATLNTAGDLVDSVSYDPFGVEIGRTGATSLMVGFQSHYTDPTTGLVDMGARWYRPSSATFLSRDSYDGIDDTPVSLNRYTYANNNPLSYWDPTGFRAIQIYGSGKARSVPPRTPKRVQNTSTGRSMFPGQARFYEQQARKQADREREASYARAEQNRFRTYAPKRSAEQTALKNRKDIYASHDLSKIEGDATRAAVATQVVEDYFVTFDVAHSRDTQDANGDISPKDYRRVADPANGYPEELQWAAQEVLTQGLEDQFHTNKSLWEKHGGAAVGVLKTALSFVPVVGDVIDVLDCVSGDLIACAGAIPGLGVAVAVTKAAKAIDKAADLGRGVDATRTIDKLEDTITTAKAPKRGPKPWPEGPHNQTIQRRIGELEADGLVHTHGGSLPEEVIPTPGGCKTCRRPDITMTRPDGSTYRENVGRTRADGSPIAREVEALDDLEDAIGVRPGYTGYD